MFDESNRSVAPHEQSLSAQHAENKLDPQQLEEHVAPQHAEVHVAPQPGGEGVDSQSFESSFGAQTTAKSSSGSIEESIAAAHAIGNTSPDAASSPPSPASVTEAQDDPIDASATITAPPEPSGTDAVRTVEPPRPKMVLRGKNAPRLIDPAIAEERKQRMQVAWDHVAAAKEHNTTIEGMLIAAVKGGVTVDVGGIRGFLPASQTRLPQGETIEALLRSKMALKVIDLDEARRRIVVSQLRVTGEQLRAQRDQLLASLKIGATIEGKVVRLTDFGAFVDLGGIDGLIPMRELAHERVEKAADVLTVGETLNVEVIRIEEGGKKIGLSRKNALHDPWIDGVAALRPGTTLQAKIVAKEPQLMAEIAPDVIGTIREGDADPNDYAIGEEVEVSIRYIDRRTRKIMLTTLLGDVVARNTTTNSSSGFGSIGAELEERARTRTKRRR